MPKLRIRTLAGDTARVAVDQNATLDQLRRVVASQLLPGKDVAEGEIRLSLNKRDAIDAQGETELASLGIRSGDLLWVLHPPGAALPVARASTTATATAPAPADTFDPEQGAHSSSGAGQAGQPKREVVESNGADLHEATHPPLPGMGAPASLQVPPPCQQQGTAHDEVTEGASSDAHDPGEGSLPSDEQQREEERRAVEAAHAAAAQVGSPSDTAAAAAGASRPPPYLEKVLAANAASVHGSQAALLVCVVHAAMLDMGVEAGADPYELPAQLGASLFRLQYRMSAPEHAQQQQEQEPAVRINVVCSQMGDVLSVFAESSGGSRATGGTAAIPNVVRRVDLQLSQHVSQDWPPAAPHCPEPVESGPSTRGTAAYPAKHVRGHGPGAESAIAGSSHTAAAPVLAPEALPPGPCPGAPPGASALGALPDPRGLWRSIKDGIALPLAADAARTLGLQHRWGLLALPGELLDAVLAQVPAKDLAHVACVCAALRHAVEADALWEPLYEQEFGCRPPATAGGRAPTGGWAAAFARAWRAREELRRRRRHAHVHPLRFRPPPFPGNPWAPQPFPYGAGIVGGDVDRLPVIGGGPGDYRTGPFGMLGSMGATGIARGPGGRGMGPLGGAGGPAGLGGSLGGSGRLGSGRGNFRLI